MRPYANFDKELLVRTMGLFAFDSFPKPLYPL